MTFFYLTGHDVERVLKDHKCADACNKAPWQVRFTFLLIENEMVGCCIFFICALDQVEKFRSWGFFGQEIKRGRAISDK